VLSDRSRVLEAFERQLKNLSWRDERCRFWTAALTLPDEARDAFAACVYEIDNINLREDNAQQLFELTGPLVHFALQQDRSGQLASYSAFHPLALITADLLKLDHGDSVYDSACGLLDQLVEVQRRHANTLLRLYGQDNNLLALGLAQINALMNGINHVNLQLSDTLVNPGFRQGSETQKFDAVLCSPPFGLTSTGPVEVLQLPGRFAYGEPKGRSLEWAFVQDALYRTRKGGQTLVTVPSGVLSRSGYETEIRRALLASRQLNLVVSLPMGTLAPLTRIPVHLLRFQAVLEGQQDKVLFIDATRDPLQAAYNMPEPDVSIWVQRLIERPEEFPTQARWVSHEEIERHGMNWLPEVYLAPAEPVLDLSVLQQEVDRQTTVTGLARATFLNAMKEMK
jgi:type I restriction-modification system DNA methylase subunit